jgi:hypothetical protein
VLGVLPERMMSIPTGRVRHRPLEDFERLYVGVGAENYGWYQLMLTAAAKKIYEAAGADGLRALYRTFATREGGLTDARLARLLEERVHPKRRGSCVRGRCNGRDERSGAVGSTSQTLPPSGRSITVFSRADLAT